MLKAFPHLDHSGAPDCISPSKGTPRPLNPLPIVCLIVKSLLGCIACVKMFSQGRLGYALKSLSVVHMLIVTLVFPCFGKLSIQLANLSKIMTIKLD